MIKVNQLVDNLQNLLNSNAIGVTFRLFTDTGKYQQAEREYNTVTDYINGITTVTTTDISNTNDGMEYGTMTLRTEILVRCRDTEEDVYEDVEDENGETEQELIEEGNDNYIASIRAFLDDIFAKQSFANMTDDSGKFFNVSVGYSLAMSGVRNQNPHTGDSYTFVFYAYYNLIQSGENSRLYIAYLDGEQLPYSVMTMRRVPVQEQNVFSGSGDSASRAVNSGSTFGLSLECPAFQTTVNTVVKQYILNGADNTVHFLNVDLNGVRKTFLVMFGEVDNNAMNILNANLTLTFVEAVNIYGIISFPASYYVYRYTGTTNGTIVVTTPAAATVYNVRANKFYKTQHMSGSEYAETIQVAQGDIIVCLEEITNTADADLTAVQGA